MNAGATGTADHITLLGLFVAIGTIKLALETLKLALGTLKLTQTLNLNLWSLNLAFGTLMKLFHDSPVLGAMAVLCCMVT